MNTALKRSFASRAIQPLNPQLFFSFCDEQHHSYPHEEEVIARMLSPPLQHSSTERVANTTAPHHAWIEGNTPQQVCSLGKKMIQEKKNNVNETTSKGVLLHIGLTSCTPTPQQHAKGEGKKFLSLLFTRLRPPPPSAPGRSPPRLTPRLRAMGAADCTPPRRRWSLPSPDAGTAPCTPPRSPASPATS